jgi:hypothetical protein
MADQLQFARITLVALPYLSQNYHGRLPVRTGGRDTDLDRVRLVCVGMRVRRPALPRKAPGETAYHTVAPKPRRGG